MSWGSSSGNGRTTSTKPIFRTSTRSQTLPFKNITFHLSPFFLLFFLAFTKSFSNNTPCSAFARTNKLSEQRLLAHGGGWNKNTHTQKPQAVPHECIHALVSPAHKNSAIRPTTIFTRPESPNTRPGQIWQFVEMTYTLRMHDGKEKRETRFARRPTMSRETRCKPATLDARTQTHTLVQLHFFYTT